ncbi:hypothetical protein [Spiroplasma clarkii]|uniref:hypothetical protein n=1 Tax=Spiroplasma clarkii TaxID=2139 RepID=UPI0011BABA80|nr:hypothetical protein [Spiroplasma clarkii]
MHIKKQFHQTSTRKEKLMMKVFVISDVQEQLTRNRFLKEWITRVYYYVFPNQKLVDNLFDSKHIYYKKQKPLEEIYRSVKLKNLNWVFNRTFPSVRIFLESYLDKVKNWVKEKKYTQGFVPVWYDSITYLQNKIGSSSFTKKENKRNLKI